MDSTIIAALIGAAGTIVAAIITVLIATRKQGPPSHAHSPLAESPHLAGNQIQPQIGAPAAKAATQESPPT